MVTPRDRLKASVAEACGWLRAEVRDRDQNTVADELEAALQEFLAELGPEEGPDPKDVETS